MRGKFFQGTFLVLVNVAALVLRKTEHEKPPVCLIGRHQRAKPAAFTMSLTGNLFFKEPATQIRFIQSSRHFTHRFAEAQTCTPQLSASRRLQGIHGKSSRSWHQVVLMVQSPVLCELVKV